MQHSIVERASSPTAATASSFLPRVRMGRAVTALLLMAVLSTAAIVHVIWQGAAARNVEKVVATLDAQSASAVRGDLTSTLTLVASTAEIVRSILFQGAIKADDEVRREFLFLSLLREQPTIAWIGFVLVSPFVGAFLYWLFGINRVSRRARCHPRPPAPLAG